MLTARGSTVSCLGSRPQVAPRQAPCRPARSAVAARASLQSDKYAAQSARRQVLLGFAGLGLASGFGGVVADRADAAEVTYETFLGLATPPTSYGGYGGNDPGASPKYSFEYPTGWKADKISKVEKGTQGIDGRVSNTRVKGQSAFVVTLGRAGEDNKSFILRDLDSTFQGFAGADADLQDALNDASDIKKTSHKDEASGINFYDYDITSPDFHYLSTVAVKDGKVFALFVRSPARSFAANEEKLRHIVGSFKLL